MLDSGQVRGLPWNVFLLAFLTIPQTLSPAEQPRQTLNCKVAVFEPRLDFEFRFYTGYQVSIPSRQLAGPERKIDARLLITPLEPAEAEPTELTSSGAFPAVKQGSRGHIAIDGSFAVGPGRYRVEWSIVDSLNRGCSLNWEIEAGLTKRDGEVKLQLEPGHASESRMALFRPENVKVDESLGRPLRVKVLLNLDVWNRRRARVRLFEFMPRLAALRAMSRHPRIGEVALTAFSVDEQSVYFRQPLRNRVDFPRLRPAIDKISPAIVSIEQLAKDSSRDFLTKLLLEELPGDEPVDAYVFLGPDPEPGRKAKKESLAEIGALGAPTVYLTFTQAPWKGLMGTANKAVGGKQIRYRNPRELAEALAALVEMADSAAGN